ncbi:ArsR/SmtB family transcription factor [Streptomyces minutiscleroticus]|uniref:ArsR/SmtB family transcription factor n=1 Tax=Streptomyces minutiscleroticus TaxID=68238 RepID=UPI0033277D63
MHHELHALPPARRNLPWAKALANGAAADLGRLTDGMSLFLQQAVSPYWPAIERQLTADRDRRAGAVLHGGVDHLLATLHPDAVWQPPVLLVRNTPIERDLHLRGRGLKILPSFFCWRHPVVLRDPDLPPVLVLPIEHDPRWVLHTASRKQQQVAALIGRTRAALLEATARSQCTTDLARQIHTSASCTSEHLKVLREAGLITTRREGVAAIHTLSPLGRCLLDGVPQRSD